MSGEKELEALQEMLYGEEALKIMEAAEQEMRLPPGILSLKQTSEEPLEESIDLLFQKMCTDIETLFGYGVPRTTILERLMQSIPMERIVLSAGTANEFLEFWDGLKATNNTRNSTSPLTEAELEDLHNSVVSVYQNRGTNP